MRASKLPRVRIPTCTIECCMLYVEVTDGLTSGCINSEYIGFPFESRRIPGTFVTPSPAAGACDTIS